ncbi:MAG TPA: thiamine-phosphate kinase [Bacillales bacterium]|nr:thiamine-phosphate kinase [Bacillales bacterium]
MQDEFSFIHQITPKRSSQPSLIHGIGDDAALFAGEDGFEEIVCMDTMVEGIHFTRQTMSPFDIGYKALAVNVSDIAAMGGMPTYYLVSVAVPQSWGDELKEVYQGMADLAKAHEMDLIGGDTVSAETAFVLTVTVLGRVEKGRHLLRSSAKPGDLVFVTGPLGDSAAGLSLLLKNGRAHPFSNDQQKLIRAHQRPVPQVKAGRILSALSTRIALNDVSDGIASEANEIAEASGVTLVLDYEKLPRSKVLRTFSTEKQREWVLFGGEDFQLIGTVPETKARKLEKQFPVTFIGTVEEGEAEVILKENGQIKRLERKGFNHFDR